MEPLRDGVDSAFMSGASDPLAYLRCETAENCDNSFLVCDLVFNTNPLSLRLLQEVRSGGH